MASANKPIEFILVESNRPTTQNAEIIVETPVSLTVNGENWLTFMCTPTDLEALAIGFLFNENLIESYSEIADVRVCAAGDNVDVWLHHSVERPNTWRKTSGCTGGVTSVVTDMAQIADGSIKNRTDWMITPAQVGRLIDHLFMAQDLYQKSGGVHTSALSDGKCFLVVAEDIGRHNTLDKIAGRILMDQIDPPNRILITTGRISSEMLQKANRIGASVVISRTSPSSLSIDLANRFGITLIGYARCDRFRIYAHPERLVFCEEGYSDPRFQILQESASDEAKRVYPDCP